MAATGEYMKTVKSVGVMSVAKLEAVIMAIAGLIMGVLYAFASASLGVLGTVVGGSAGFLLGFGLLSIVVMPVLFAIMGFIAGAIGAFLYNIVAGKVGGIELEFDKE